LAQRRHSHRGEARPLAHPCCASFQELNVVFCGERLDRGVIA